LEARAAVELGLFRRGTRTFQRPREVWNLQLPGDRRSEQRRLVESALEQTRDVERHGYDSVHVERKTLGFARQELAERSRELGNGRVFEARDGRCDRPAINERRSVVFRSLDGVRATHAKHCVYT